MEKLESRLNGKIGALESQIGELRERMAHLEGFLEGLREAITGRAAAGLGDEKAMQSKRGGGPRQAFRREGANCSFQAQGAVSNPLMFLKIARLA